MTWKQVSNADAGDADHFGGNDIDKISQAFSGTDVDDFDINCDFTVRSGKFHWRNPANTFSYDMVAAAIGATRTLNLPLLTGSGTIASLSGVVDQTFTERQIIKKDQESLFKLYRDTNVNDNRWSIEFNGKDSASNETNYATLYGTILTNTNGSEDGAFSINVMQNGSTDEVLWVDGDGFFIKGGNQTNYVELVGDNLTADRSFWFPDISGDIPVLQDNNQWGDVQIIRHNLSSEMLHCFRESNATGTSSRADILFRALDSGSANQTYARIRQETVDATAGSEDGSLRFFVTINGTETETMRLDEFGDALFGSNLRIRLSQTGLTAQRSFTFPDTAGQVATLNASQSFTVGQDIRANATNLLYLTKLASSNDWYLHFRGQDSASNLDDYGKMGANIEDNTNGSEDASLRFMAQKAGTLTDVFRSYGTGEFDIGNNLRLRLVETGLTTQRTTKFPNADNTVIGTGTASGSTVSTNTTNTIFDLLNYSVPANAMGANGFVKFLITGNILQNQATGTTYTITVVFGGTTLFADATAAIAQSASRMPMWIEGIVFNKNATNAQGFDGNVRIGDQGGATTGIGDISDDEVIGCDSNADSEGADSAIDTTAAVTLQVRMTMSVSNAAVETRVKHKSVEVHTFA